MDLDKAIKERHSVRSFKKTKKIAYQQVIEAIVAASKAPLAGSIAAIYYVLVQDKEKIKALAVAAQQDFVEDVDYVVVICADRKDLERNYYDRGKMYAHQEAGAAIENMLLKLTELGLATCWVGAFSEETVKRVLTIPDSIDVEALLPIGLELGKTTQKRKPELDNNLFFDKWKNKFMKPKRMAEGSQT